MLEKYLMSTDYVFILYNETRVKTREKFSGCKKSSIRFIVSR